MSYQVLARKWRPQSFDEVTGQEHVTLALRNAIRQERVPHAILLTGPRGVGKTTIARILARCLNCDKGPTDAPCGGCSACSEIAAGTSTDVQEIDAASRTSVDDVRELIEAIRYAPSPGKHRIYVVDEVHMLSTQAFNALLKTLEEPPPRSLFIFATTNPEKIPFTVVSRCQRHDLRRIGIRDLVARLRELSGIEKLEISDRSLMAIARESDGSLRDAMTLLDQVIAVGGAQVDDERVAEMLDLIDRRLVLAILEACVDGDAPRALEACGRAAEAGIEARRLGAALLDNLRDLVVLRAAPDAPQLVEGSDAEIEELRAIAARNEATRLRRMFRALVREQEDLAWAPQAFQVLEMALLRLATLPDGDDVARLLARLDALERKLAGGGGGGNSGSPTGNPAGGASGSRGGTPPSRAGSSAAPAEAQASSAPAASGEAATAPETAGEDVSLAVIYDRLRSLAQQANRGLFAVLDEGSLLERSAGAIRIALPEGFATRRLRGRVQDLESVCERLFGHPTRVEIEGIGGDPGKPRHGPAEDSDLARRRRQEALNDPAVNGLVEVLGAEVVEIRPLGGGQ